MHCIINTGLGMTNFSVFRAPCSIRVGMCCLKAKKLTIAALEYVILSMQEQINGRAQCTCRLEYAIFPDMSTMNGSRHCSPMRTRRFAYLLSAVYRGDRWCSLIRCGA